MVHRTVSGAHAGGAAKQGALGNSPRAPWLKFTGLSDEPTAPMANGRLCDQWMTRGRANGHLVTPDSVRCTKEIEGPTVGFARKGRRSGTRQELFMSGGAPDCLVHHSTEGKDCFLSGTPTAPRPLGSIKGTPRHLQQKNMQPTIVYIIWINSLSLVYISLVCVKAKL